MMHIVSSNHGWPYCWRKTVTWKTEEERSVFVTRTVLNVVFWNWSWSWMTVYPPGWIADMLSATKITSKTDTIFYIKWLILWRWDRQRPDMFLKNTAKEHQSIWCSLSGNVTFFVTSRSVAKNLRKYHTLKAWKVVLKKFKYWTAL